MVAPSTRSNPRQVVILPTLPIVPMRALNLMRDPRSSARDVEKVVSQDQALSARILRLANSALYGCVHKVATVSQAIALIGFSQLQAMIVSVSLFNAFTARRLHLSDFWRHSIATGAVARFLAQRLYYPPEEAFTIGILHDIGKLALISQDEELYIRVLHLQRNQSLFSTDAERALLGTTHTQVGAVLGEKWGLPNKYVNSLYYHHSPAQTHVDRKLCFLISLANVAAHTVLPSVFTSKYDERLLQSLLQHLDLNPLVWQQCLQHLKESQAEIQAFLAAMH